MQLGMIGLGRMGSNMVRRLMRGGHSCVVRDVSADAVTGLAKEGATGSSSMEDFVQKLSTPRTVCLMVPAALVDSIVDELVPHLQRDDVIIDGGNSHYHDDIRRAGRLQPACLGGNGHREQATEADHRHRAGGHRVSVDAGAPDRVSFKATSARPGRPRAHRP